MEIGSLWTWRRMLLDTVCETFGTDWTLRKGQRNWERDCFGGAVRQRQEGRDMSTDSDA